MKKMTKRVMLCLLLGLTVLVSAAQQRRITGTVKDDKGSPVAGATFTIKGTNIAGATDENGNYSVTVNDANAVLVFSSVSFATREVAVGQGNTLNVVLNPADGALTEVVVTALGIKREQRKVGYATTTINAQEIVKAAPTNFASALYGRAAGVTINTNPGGATSAVSVQIRGINSIGYQRQPLLVVDGVVIRNGDANNEGYWGGNQRLNPNGLLDINPENIETINVLKGAAASALYGSDANFGVIVITTKNGRKNAGLGIDVNVTAGLEEVSVTPDLQTEYGRAMTE